MRTLLITTQCLLLACCWSPEAAAQDANPPVDFPKPVFRHLTVADGLSDNLVSALYQDTRGVLWIGHNGGFSNYDGYGPLPYWQHINTYTSTFFEDHTGTLWIAEQLSRVNRDTGALEPLTDIPRVSTIFESPSEPGVLWLGSWANGLHRLDLQTGEGNVFREALSNATVSAIHEDQNGMLWVATNDGLNRLNRETGAVRQYFHPSRGTPADSTHPLTHVLQILEDISDPNVFWLAEAWGLSRFDTMTGDFERVLSYPIEDTDGLFWTMPQAMVRDPVRKQVLWMIWKGGLIRYDTYTGRSWKYPTNPGTDPKNAKGPGTRPQCLFVDRSGVIWIGTLGSGLSYFDATAEPPGLLLNFDLSVSPDVYSLLVDGEGSLWTGMARDSPLAPVWIVSRLDRASGAVLHAWEVTSAPISMIEDREGSLWIGTEAAPEGSLFRLDRTRETLAAYRYDPENTGGPAPGGMHTFYIDRSGHLWAGSGIPSQGDEEGGLSRLVPGDPNDPSDDTFEVFRHDPEHPRSLPSRFVLALFEDLSGRFWIGTADGLALMDWETGTFDTTSFTHTVTLIHERAAEPGVLWLGSDDGLTRYDTRDASFAPFGSSYGLPDARPMDILEDDQSMLWISYRFEGLFAFHPDTRFVRRLETHRQFRHGTGFRSPSGKMFFGSTWGTYTFFPDRVLGNPFPPQVILSDVTTLATSEDQDVRTAFTSALREQTALRLPFQQNTFTLGYKAVHFADPGKNQYAYRMVGLQEEWVQVGTQRTATFNSLSPGNYVFEVKASNAYGVWNEEPTSVAFIILPPWWRTWWAYTLFGLLLAAAFFAIGRTRHRIAAQREARRLMLREAEVRAEAAEELDRTKNRFFANITHEFRTPLTLLLGPLEEYVQHPDDSDRLTKKAPVMRRNAQRLLRLVNQLLDLSRLEAGRTTLHPEPGDLAGFLRELVRSFAPLADRKQLILQFQAEPKHLPCRFDPDALEKIAANLVSNALKFTPEHGKVHVSLSSEPQDAHLAVTLTVRDTGVGIPREAHAHLFKRFEQVDSSDTRAHEGTGIGLALVHELAELHGGSIRLESEVGFGSTFTVHLPLQPSPPEALQTTDSAETPGQRATALELAVLEETAPRTEPEASSSGPTVLVVDDNADVRAYIRDHLQAHYHIVEAGDGEEGLALAHAHQPVLILSDVMMPKLDGFGLCRAVKTDEKLRHIPVILLTARADETDRITGLKEGADDYLTKPFSLRELEVRVANLILSRRQLRALFNREVRVRPTDVVIEAEEETFLNQVLETLNRHLGDSNFSVEMLADAVNLSRRQVERRVKQMVGKTPPELLREMRLERASQILKARPGSVAEVAYTVGFKSPSHFSAAFRKAYGRSPSEHSAG